MECKRPKDATDFMDSPEKDEREKPKLEGKSYSHVAGCSKISIINNQHPKKKLEAEYC